MLATASVELGLDPRMPDDSNPRDLKSRDRRELLKLSPLLLLGAFAVPPLKNELLKSGIAFTDWASAKWFRRNHLAPTFSAREVTPLEKFYVNTHGVADPEVDLDNWTLKVSGDVQRPGEYTLTQIQALPKLAHITRHVCVDGWDAIVPFGGTALSTFLNFVGANLNAKFLFVECADGYYESIGMASALHPQSLLCYEMYEQPLTREHGAPLRLRLPTKIGYKSAKYLTNFRVTDILTKVGYWEDKGYPATYNL
jgi:DMSO/TMAO reductase YedYZ molybdopterin-dependent catalytic subunit